MNYRLRLSRALWALVTLAAVSVAAAPSAGQATMPSRDPATPTATSRAALSGKVTVAANGKAIAGASVYLIYTAKDLSQQRIVATAITDATGDYRIDEPIIWGQGISDENARLAQRYYLLAVHPQTGMSFTVILRNDRIGDVQLPPLQGTPTTLAVMDKGGRPIPGANVYCSSGTLAETEGRGLDLTRRAFYLLPELGILSGVTDADGRVTLPGLGGRCAYTASKPGYVANSASDFIRLLPSRKVSGRVLYTDGVPVAGASVTVRYQGAQVTWESKANADAQGRYAFDDVPTSGYHREFYGTPEQLAAKGTISVEAREAPRNISFITAPVSFEARDDESAPRDIVIERTCLVGGNVVDGHSGAGLAGIRLAAYRGDAPNGPPMHQMITDSQGAFEAVVPAGSRVTLRWMEPPDGAYEIDREWARKEMPRNYEIQPLPEMRLSSDKTDIVLKLRLLGMVPLIGTVVDESGQPIGGVTVWHSAHMPAVTTDARGQFTLNGSPKSQDAELCMVSRDRTRAGLFRIPRGTTEMRFDLKPTITKTVAAATFDGTPADGLVFAMHIRLNGEDHLYLPGMFTTRDDGTATAESLIPGVAYTISWSTDGVTNRDYEDGKEIVDPALLATNEPIRFTAPKYNNTLIGRILDDMGQPVADATVTVAPGDPLLTREGRIAGATFRVDGQGQFKIPRLASGRLTLKASAPARRASICTFASNDADAKVVLRSTTGLARYRAKALNAQGQPVPGAKVFLLFSRTAANGETNKLIHSRIAAADGTTEFDGSPQKATLERAVSGKTAVFCTAPGYDLATLEPVGHNDDLNVELMLRRSTIAWKGKVVDSANVAIAGAKVTTAAIADAYGRNILSMDEFAGLEPEFLVTRTSADGTFQVPGASSPSQVQVRIEPSGFPPLPGSFGPSDGLGQCKIFAVNQGFTLNGRMIIKSTGKPLQVGSMAHKPLCCVVFTGSDGAALGATMPRPDGTFTMQITQPGRHFARFAAIDPSFAKWVSRKPVAFDAIKGGRVELTMELEEGILLSGAMKGMPADYDGLSRRAYVVARNPSDRLGGASCSVDPDGSWQIYLPASGEYVISYSMPPNIPETKGPTITVHPARPFTGLELRLPK